MKKESRAMEIHDGDTGSFGTLLRAYRIRRGLTQHQLAEKLDIRRNTVGTWERGDYLPASKALVLELARHLHLDVQEARKLLEASLVALSPYWLVPLPRNPFFTGREAILETLHAQLRVDRSTTLTQSLALHGLGGLGKTQIALEYAYRHALEYSAVFWIRAESDESVVASLLDIAEVLQLPGRNDKDQQRVVMAVQRWFTTHGQWLLIWDNVEDLTLLGRFLPSGRQGAFLLTTRHQALGTWAQSLDLLPMEAEEGTMFLLRRAKVLTLEASVEQAHQSVEQKAAGELVTAMGGLPLALDQAGAYLEETQCGLAAYLELFRTRHSALLQQRGEGGRDHPASVSTTFTLAITATAQRHPAVNDLLRVCALLQPDAIPEELFRQGAEHLGDVLANACGDMLEWNQVVAAASASSLLSRQPAEQTLSLHGLVQAILLGTMTESEQDLWHRRTSAALDAIFPDTLPETEYTAWKPRARLVPHALLLLQRAGAESSSLTLASLAFKTAQHLRARGRYAQAEPLYQRALEIREAMLGPGDLEVAPVLYFLAEVSYELSKYAQAETLYLRALEIREHILGPDHPEVATSLSGLAFLYWMQGKFTRAEALYQRALEIREAMLGPDHLEVASSLRCLAEVSQERGEYAQAEPLYLRGLAICERLQGPNALEVAFLLSGLAFLYQRQAKYEESEQLYQRILQICEQALEPDHPYMAISLHSLALLYAEQSKDAQAEELYQRALQIWEQALGADHPWVAHAFVNLARLHRKRGEDVEAEELCQRALQIWEQTLGSEHPWLAYALQGLANLSRDQGAYAKAEPLYQRALSIQEQSMGLHHTEPAQTLYELALLRQKQGRWSEALSFAERVYTIRSQAFGDAHPKTVIAQTLRAQLLQEESASARDLATFPVTRGEEDS